LNNAIPDDFTWKGNNDGTYSANAGYRWLLRQTDNILPQASASWRWIWLIAAPKKVKFFIWTVCQQSLPTRDMLNS